MIATAKRLLPGVVTLTMTAAAVPAVARPLLNSDLPPDLRDDAIARRHQQHGAEHLGQAHADALGQAHNAPSVHHVAARYHYSESGEASFYRSSRVFARTATGEKYNEMAMTAAHPSLPLGTRVRVTRKDTGKSVVVRINDRQGNQSRVIDLSYGAARRLGIHGVGQVTVTEILPGDIGVEPVEVAEAPEDRPARQPLHTAHVAPHVRHMRTAAHSHPRTAHKRTNHASVVSAEGAVQPVALVRHSAPHRVELRRL